MTPHPATLEAYNRATFDPPTPEIELAPAETLQVEHDRPTPMSILATIPARDFFAAFGLAAMLYLLATGIAAVLP